VKQRKNTGETILRDDLESFFMKPCLNRQDFCAISKVRLGARITGWISQARPREPMGDRLVPTKKSETALLDEFLGVYHRYAEFTVS
jgi:hypothetical protein